MKTIVVALLAVAAPAQMPKEPAKDLFMHSAQAPGMELRVVDYHWQPAFFEAMEKGSGAIPEAKRNWVVARVILNSRPMTFFTARRLPVGNYGLVLWPNLDGKGMAIEMRRIDMREGLPGRERDRSRSARRDDVQGAGEVRDDEPARTAVRRARWRAERGHGHLTMPTATAGWCCRRE